MRYHFTAEQGLVLVAAAVTTLLIFVVSRLAPLTARDRSILTISFLLGGAVAGYIAYRAAQIGLRRQYPLAPSLALGLNLITLILLHPYFPTIDLILFLTTAGTGVIWGFWPGLTFGVITALSHLAVGLAYDPLTLSTALNVAVFDGLLIVIGGLTGLLSTQEQRQRAQSEAVSAQNARLAEELRDINVSLETRVVKGIAEVQQTQRQNDELYEMITHDLKNPLGTIQSALLIVQDSLTPEATQAQQAVEAALRAGDRQLELIENLLDLRRLRAQALPLNLEPVDLISLLDTEVELIRPRASRKGLQLEKKFAAELPRVLADRQLLARVLSNLLENACKFTPLNGAITIAASGAVSHLRVSVTDTGAGVPEPERQAIFEKYHQILNGNTSAHDGAGVGLAFCKMAVEAMNGQIRVVTALSGGAQFEVTLPLVTPADRADDAYAV